MKPISPVLPGHEKHEVVYAKNQKEYMPLPMLQVASSPGPSGVSRWKLTWRERLTILLNGEIYIWHLHFGRPLQPLLPSATFPLELEEDGEARIEFSKETAPPGPPVPPRAPDHHPVG